MSSSSQDQKRKGEKAQGAKKSKYKVPSQNDSRAWIWVALVVVVVAAVVFGGIYMLNKKNQELESAKKDLVEPGLTFTGGVKITEDGALAFESKNVKDDASEVIIFEDPICPACAGFEQRAGSRIYKGVDDGKIKLKVRMLDFLNQASSSKDYSTRANAAVQCVIIQETREVTQKFKAALFENQPEENGSEDLTNEQLADLAEKAGASSPKTRKCIIDGTRVEKARKAALVGSDELSKTGSNGTPTVVIDGDVVQMENVDSALDELLS